MCEWLSSREWSDVRLQCGGRSFAAHRAVLASVSSFLHRLLLSCPMEDSPTFIVLPDFDLDAMSSVLYYIYNGEVVIQEQKLEMFMEIVKTMQIFVDEQYLPSACKSTEDIAFCSKYDQKTSGTNRVFCLGEETADTSFVKLKKEYRSDCALFKKSHNDSGTTEKQIRCAGLVKNNLENLASVCGDRQRSFLRDLFIETYPRNGNANGRAAGVLAIQSARYRTPASALLTNANGKHLREDTHEMHSKSTNVPPWYSNFSPLTQNANNICDLSRSINTSDLAQIKKLNSAFSYFNSNPLLDPSKNELNNPLIEYFSVHQTHTQELLPGIPTLDLRDIESYTSMHQKPFGTTCLFVDKNFQGRKINDIDANLNVTHYNKTDSTKTTLSVFSKTAVLNEVLDSPWRPRQPTNYRPFRRKLQDSSSASENNLKECLVNDNNNNVQPSLTPEVRERISANACSMNPPQHISGLAVGSDFKCAVCDQVFTNEDTLTAHARRHSSPARYSCTECSKSFSQLRNFKYHMSVHRGTKEFAATCPVCGKYFNDRGYLSSHMKIHRNRKEYKCPQCPKSFNQRVAYNMHVRIHTGIKPHVCNECGKAFSRKMLLKQHQRTHSGERPYACPHCDKRFADRSNMTLHLRLHTGVKPFSCTLCPKSFTKKHHLKSHLNFHTGAKPYSCPKCKLAFTQSSNMRTHLKKCTAPEPTENAETTNSS